MDSRHRLAQNLVSESNAYGYSLTVWGSGAILVARYGTPTPPQVIAYVAGALVAFGLLAAVAFDAFLGDVETESPRHLFVTSMVHVVATLGNLLVSWLLVVPLAASALPAVVGFSLVGVQSTLLYNVLLLAEEALARTVARPDDSP